MAVPALEIISAKERAISSTLYRDKQTRAAAQQRLAFRFYFPKSRATGKQAEFPCLPVSRATDQALPPAAPVIASTAPVTAATAATTAATITIIPATTTAATAAIAAAIAIATAATIAATTTVAATATVATTAAGALFARAGLVDIDAPPFDICPIERLNGSLGLALGGHLDKAKAARLLGHLVLDDRGRADFAVGFKGSAQIILGNIT
jgi:hypothetical protein